MFTRLINSDMFMENFIVFIVSVLIELQKLKPPYYCYTTVTTWFARMRHFSSDGTFRFVVVLTVPAHAHSRYTCKALLLAFTNVALERVWPLTYGNVPFFYHRLFCLAEGYCQTAVSNKINGSTKTYVFVTLES